MNEFRAGKRCISGASYRHYPWYCVFIGILVLLLLFIPACNKGPADDSSGDDDDNPPDDEKGPAELVADRYDAYESAMAQSGTLSSLMAFYSPSYHYNGMSFADKSESLSFCFDSFRDRDITFTNTYRVIDPRTVEVTEKAQWRGIFDSTGGTVVDSWERLLRWEKEGDDVWRIMGNQDSGYSWTCIEDARDDEILYSIVTDDGKRLTLTRLAATTDPVTSPPLVLCHGIAANRYTFDIGQYSLARHLRDRGFDVWLVDLRGHGRSYFPDTWDGSAYDWQVEDYIVHDVPAIISAVCQNTASSSVIWIGHSMGGMVAYGHCIHAAKVGQDPGISALITIGSPGYIDFKNTGTLFSPGWIFDFLMSQLDNLLKSYPYLFNVNSYSNLLTFLSLFGISENDFLSMIWNPANMDDEVAAFLVDKGAHNICGEEIRAFNAFYEEKSFFSPDHSLIYKDLYNLVTVPLLVINGGGDEIGVTDSVRWVFDHAGSNDRTYRQFSLAGREVIYSLTENVNRPMSDSCDYGHLDLVVGTGSPNEIYPYVTLWITRHVGQE